MRTWILQMQEAKSCLRIYAKQQPMWLSCCGFQLVTLGWWMVLMLARSHSPQLAEEDIILSCANILHVDAEAYGLLMPSLALGNNIIKKGGGRKWKKGWDKGKDVKANEKEGAERRRSEQGGVRGTMSEREREKRDRRWYRWGDKRVCEWERERGWDE